MCWWTAAPSTASRPNGGGRAPLHRFGGEDVATSRWLPTHPAESKHSLDAAAVGAEHPGAAVGEVAAVVTTSGLTRVGGGTAGRRDLAKESGEVASDRIGAVLGRVSEGKVKNKQRARQDDRDSQDSPDEHRDHMARQPAKRRDARGGHAWRLRGQSLRPDRNAASHPASPPAIGATAQIRGVCVRFRLPGEIYLRREIVRSVKASMPRKVSAAMAVIDQPTRGAVATQPSSPVTSALDDGAASVGCRGS